MDLPIRRTNPTEPAARLSQGRSGASRPGKLPCIPLLYCEPLLSDYPDGILSVVRTHRGGARGSRPGREHGARVTDADAAAAAPQGPRSPGPECSAFLGASSSGKRPHRGWWMVRDALERRVACGVVGSGAVEYQGRRSLARLGGGISAPCHALPGRVGGEGSVNGAYDLAGWENRLARRHVWGGCTAPHNKRMQLTKGGWRRVAASWSACSAVGLSS
jgi:hypothetical protein